VLAASLKSVDEVVAVLMAGAHHVTLPMSLIDAMAEHSLTQQAVVDFDAALSQGAG
jgi:transaldolase